VNVGRLGRSAGQRGAVAAKAVEQAQPVGQDHQQGDSQAEGLHIAGVMNPFTGLDEQRRNRQRHHRQQQQDAVAQRPSAVEGLQPVAQAPCKTSSKFLMIDPVIEALTARAGPRMAMMVFARRHFRAWR
jgi:hypothetical protein